ncbi:DUF1206 domain-containing protein [Bifidobacterium sp. UBA4282]|uniref:DUF1206 domain-containing protein n=1 Tax=Bifidobacterium sp. UBA4282 TaxID=1946096 RepID=UPI0025B87650|nr:DUF1206 domain-containing protein [Bifidobacterium sp. UBA4282]
MLRIDENELHSLLRDRRPHIGSGPVVSAAANVIAAIFYIPTVNSAPCMLAKIGYGAFAIISLIIGGYNLRKSITSRYTDEDMYKDVTALNRKLIRSSIVAVTSADRPNQYLLYHDNGWDCDFFPNHRTNGDYETDKANMAEYLNREYGMDIKPSSLRLVGTNTNSKLSTEHNEVREYEYRLYLLRLTSTPDTWDSDAFRVLDKDCRMMTVGGMLSDKRINEVNHDVVAMVRDLV